MEKYEKKKACKYVNIILSLISKRTPCTGLPNYRKIPMMSLLFFYYRNDVTSILLRFWGEIIKILGNSPNMGQINNILKTIYVLFLILHKYYKFRKDRSVNKKLLI